MERRKPKREILGHKVAEKNGKTTLEIGNRTQMNRKDRTELATVFAKGPASANSTQAHLEKALQSGRPSEAIRKDTNHQIQIGTFRPFKRTLIIQVKLLPFPCFSSAIVKHSYIILFFVTVLHSFMYLE